MIGKDVRLTAWSRAYGGHFYIVFNPKSRLGMSSIGNYSELRRYAAVRQYKTEKELLEKMGVHLAQPTMSRS